MLRWFTLLTDFASLKCPKIRVYSLSGLLLESSVTWRLFSLIFRTHVTQSTSMCLSPSPIASSLDLERRTTYISVVLRCVAYRFFLSAYLTLLLLPLNYLPLMMQYDFDKCLLLLGKLVDKSCSPWKNLTRRKIAYNGYSFWMDSHEIKERAGSQIFCWVHVVFL